MLALIEGIKDHLEYPLVCLYILTILNIVQAVTDAIRIVDVCQQGRRQLVIGHTSGINVVTQSTTIVGKAHGSNLHKLASNMEAGKMTASGKYSKVALNRALKTVGLNGSKRPDVIGVSKSGKNKIVEVVSPRQSTKYIVNKVNDMVSANRNSVGKVITWVRLMFK